MIKKFFHLVCVIIACCGWCALLIGIVQAVIMLAYHTTPLAFYHSFTRFWNNGNALHGKDLGIVLMVIAFVPLCIYGWYKLYYFKYLKLLTVPLNKFFNSGYNNYVAPEVNIKNLKIEEKKTLEQIVQERLDKEKKKTQSQSSTDFRKQIIEKINESKNK
ncbi:MAG: hypothetical protein IKN71_05905 [Alphaproteobacteria bacterium]|nr:hypothetical protein [Alphaproteobacteria bacterium]